MKDTGDTIKEDKKRNSEAYKGYLICWDFCGRIWIEKDTSFISYATDIFDAKRTIDKLFES